MTAIKNEVILMGYDSVTGKSVQITVTGNAAKVTLNTAIAGETNPTSLTNAYLVTRSRSNLSVISKTTAVTIGGGAASDTQVMDVEFTAALTGTCVITGFADSDGVAQSITYPAASVAGVRDWHGSVNLAGALTVTVSNALDDNLVLIRWRPV